MKCHVALAVLVRLYKLVEVNAVGRDNSITLLTHFQIGVASKLETVFGIVRPLLCGDIHHSLVVLQLHLFHVEGEIEESVAVTVSILDGGLLPHNIFCQPRHCDEGEHHG